MLDLAVAAPVIAILAGGDIVLHIYFDIKKVRRDRTSYPNDSGFTGWTAFLLLSVIATLCSFCILAIMILSWLFSVAMETLPLLSVLWSAPDHQWGLGLVILGVGIVLHGWSRAVRRDMASSWEMDEGHVLVTKGPYSWVRHPSYASYFLSFVGLFLMWPSILSILLLLGIPGYYDLSKLEEEHLIRHFGDEYIDYMNNTGAFLPRLRRTTNSHAAPKP